jgi:hypothetical protein
MFLEQEQLLVLQTGLLEIITGLILHILQAVGLQVQDLTISNGDHMQLQEIK